MPEAAEYHRPVLVGAVIDLMDPTDGLILDGTLGGGGHARAILDHCSDCRLLAVDRDPAAHEVARQTLAGHEARVRFLLGSFSEATGDAEVTRDGLSGALLDLGVSSAQLNQDERGFTMRPGAPLDMRMGVDADRTAAEVLATSTVDQLGRIFRDGDAPRPGALARATVKRRLTRPLETSDDLVAALEAVLGRRAKHAEKARVFQALRIEVNRELQELSDALPAIRDALRPGRVLVVISYHSLEDGLVKRSFAGWSDPGRDLPHRLPVRAAEIQAAGQTLTKKPVVASPDEVAANARAKPARLRAWRKAA